MSTACGCAAQEGANPAVRSGALRAYGWSDSNELFVRWWAGEGQGQVYRLDDSGAEPTRVTHFDSFVSGWQLSQHDPNIAYTAVRRTEERRFQSVRVNMQTGEWAEVGETANQSSMDRWSPDADWIAYNYRDPERETVDIVIASPTDQDTRRVIWEAPSAMTPADWSPDSRTLLLVRYVSSTDHELWLLDIENDSTPLRLDDPEIAETFDNPRFDNDGQRIWVVMSTESGRSGFFHIDTRTKSQTHVPLELNGDIEDWTLSPDRQTAALSINHGGASELVLLDVNTHTASHVEGLPIGVIDSLVFNSRSDRLGLVMQTSRSPGEVWALHVDGEPQRWFTLGEYKGNQKLGPTIERYATFDSVDGKPRMLDAVVWSQEATEQQPVVLYLHGGPAAQIRPIYNGAFHEWASEGFAVVAPNVRGSTGYGLEFTSLDDGVLRINAVRDVGATLDWIAQDPRFDESRVMLVGPSYGGYLALAAAAEYPDRTHSVAASYAIVDLMALAESRPENMRGYTREEYGDERDPTVQAELTRISPQQRAAELTMPLLIAHGVDDDRCAVELVDRLVETVRLTNPNVMYLRFEDEGHGFTGQAALEQYGTAFETMLDDLRTR